MKAAILCIGNELLKGLTLDTNSFWLSKELDTLGLEVAFQVSVSDDKEEISSYLKHSLNNADFIITTGGLGPTADDLTREAIIEALGLESEIRQELLEFQKHHYAHAYEKMALVPKGALVIEPEYGTAAGWHIAIGKKLLFVLPGVPDEMKAMAENYVIPLIKNRLRGTRQTEVLRFFGLKEVELESEVKKYKKISYGLLPKKGIVDLYLESTGSDLKETRKLLEEPAAALKIKFAPNYLGSRFSSFESEIKNKMVSSASTLACAESVTGGLITSRITDIAGSSDFFLGGVCAYSNKSKISLLGVGPATIKTSGAVSELTAKEMALGAQAAFEADYGLATTGIAGPGGETADKKVGLNYIALAGPKDLVAKKLLLKGSRLSIKDQVANSALQLLFVNL